MKYYIDKVEVSIEEYKKALFERCSITLRNDNKYLNDDKELRKVYNKLDPLEKTLAHNLMVKELMKEYLELSDFKLDGLNFKQEKIEQQ